MSIYGKTLNLPNTSFPMKANLTAREPDWLKFWNNIPELERLHSTEVTAPIFWLHDGPPYANGDIHLGHAVNKILKDVFLKSKRLSGYQAPFIPGWDCHGLPIELQVEQALGKKSSTVVPFRAACRAYALEQIEKQMAAFKRLGILADWSKRYATMDFKVEANIVRCAGQLLEKQHIYRGYKPVHWCTACASALAEAEVEYQMKNSTAVDVLFPFETTLSGTQEPTGLVIWTTTPWTLPSNQAVAIHEEASYVLVRTNAYGCCLVAEDLLVSTMERWGLEQYSVVQRMPGRELIGKMVLNPCDDHAVPVVVSSHVSMDAGTGCVHIAPAHGEEDFELGQLHEWIPVQTLDEKGIFSSTKPWSGLTWMNAEGVILKFLSAKKRLIHQSPWEHSYPHCWRHRIPLLYRTTTQWFMRLKPLQEQAHLAIENVQWLPAWGLQRMQRMLENRPDWCLSRQRMWSVPLPLFIHRETTELHPQTHALIERIASSIEETGIDAWYQSKIEDWLPAGEETVYEKIKDGLDVWFDSGCVHTAVMGEHAGARIADLYLEGSDQYRGWFQSSLWTSLALHGTAPYRKVLTHGFVVDAEGRKMSKSQGNVIAPSDIISRFGADVLRWWVCSTDFRTEIVVSEEVLQRSADAYRRIRNTCRYLLANLHDFTIADEVGLDQCTALDRWIVSSAQRLQGQVMEAYQSYQPHLVCQLLQNFCTTELGSIYLDIIKDRQYTFPSKSLARRSAQTAIHHILQAMVRWLSPILSFTMEEVWQHLPGFEEPSVFLSQWYQGWGNPVAVDEGQWESIWLLRDLVNSALEKARNAGVIGSALEAVVTIEADEAWCAHLMPWRAELHALLLTSEVIITPCVVDSSEMDPIHQDGIQINIEKSTHLKCARCWHRAPEVGTLPHTPDLCQRCVGHLAGHAQTRHYA